VVIINLHPTTSVIDISSAIEEIGFSVRQITNIKHHQAKTALPIFFVDLEPDPSNKAFSITNAVIFRNALIAKSTGTQEPTAPTPHAVLNAVRTTQQQHAKKCLILLSHARCAVATIQPTIKAVLCIKNFKAVAINLPPLPNTINIINNTGPLYIQFSQAAQHSTIRRQIHKADPTQMLQLMTLHIARQQIHFLSLRTMLFQIL
jgi:hypothetical protein